MAWQRWLGTQWNQPTRSDHYLMQIACSVARVLSTKPAKIQPDQFRIVFTTKQARAVNRPDEAELDAHTQIAKARWGAIIGKKIPHTPYTQREQYADDDNDAPWATHVEETRYD